MTQLALTSKDFFFSSHYMLKHLRRLCLKSTLETLQIDPRAWIEKEISASDDHRSPVLLFFFFPFLYFSPRVSFFALFLSLLKY